MATLRGRSEFESLHRSACRGDSFLEGNCPRCQAVACERFYLVEVVEVRQDLPRYSGSIAKLFRTRCDNCNLSRLHFVTPAGELVAQWQLGRNPPELSALDRESLGIVGLWKIPTIAATIELPRPEVLNEPKAGAFARCPFCWILAPFVGGEKIVERTVRPREGLYVLAPIGFALDYHCPASETCGAEFTVAFDRDRQPLVQWLKGCPPPALDEEQREALRIDSLAKIPALGRSVLLPPAPPRLIDASRVKTLHGERLDWARRKVENSPESVEAARIAALGDNPDPEQLRELYIATHNGHDERIRCDDCGRDVDKAIELGDEPSYESATAMICLDCLRRALEVLENA